MPTGMGVDSWFRILRRVLFSWAGGHPLPSGAELQRCHRGFLGTIVRGNPQKKNHQHPTSTWAHSTTGKNRGNNCTTRDTGTGHRARYYSDQLRRRRGSKNGPRYFKGGGGGAPPSPAVLRCQMEPCPAVQYTIGSSHQTKATPPVEARRVGPYHGFIRRKGVAMGGGWLVWCTDQSPSPSAGLHRRRVRYPKYGPHLLHASTRQWTKDKRVASVPLFPGGPTMYTHPMRMLEQHNAKQ